MKKGFVKLGGLCALVAMMMAAMMPFASAYIDPSATTYLIQAIAGVAIAVSSVAVVFWRRAKNKVKEKSGIDFDKNKETEEEVVAYTDKEKK